MQLSLLLTTAPFGIKWSWDWEGAPQREKKCEERPTEDLPGNNSSLSEESKGRSNETVCLNK